MTFKLTKKSYDKLKENGIPEDILSQLSRLKNQLHRGESNFVEAIEKAIGSEQTDKYKPTILQSAKRNNEHLYLMGIYQRLIRGELDNLKEYGETLEYLIQKEKKQFNIRLEQETLNLEEEQLEFSDRYHDEYYKLSEVLPNTFRASFFITIYALLEHQLITICNALERDNKYKLSASDCKGKGIDQAKTYLKKFVGIDFPDQSEYWNKITNYRKVRNKIVHNGCFIEISYKLSKQSYDKLKNDGLIENIISQLRNLKDKPYKSEYSFLKDVDKVIGAEQTDKHKSTILKSAICPNDVDIYKFIENSSFLSLNRNDIQFSDNFLHEVFPVLSSFFEEFFSSWKSWAKIKNNKESDKD